MKIIMLMLIYISFDGSQERGAIVSFPDMTSCQAAADAMMKSPDVKLYVCTPQEK